MWKQSQIGVQIQICIGLTPWVRSRVEIKYWIRIHIRGRFEYWFLTENLFFQALAKPNHMGAQHPLARLTSRPQITLLNKEKTKWDTLDEMNVLWSYRYCPARWIRPKIRSFDKSSLKGEARWLFRKFRPTPISWEPFKDSAPSCTVIGH